MNNILGNYEEETDRFGGVSKATLKIIVLADCSGSMGAYGKIQSLNAAMKECEFMLKDFHDANAFVEMNIGVIKFESEASWHIPVQTMRDYQWNDLEIEGATNLGAAIRLLRDELTEENMGKKNKPPVLLLVSDGGPTDDTWRKEIDELNQLPWGQKGRSVRMAIAIGNDAQEGEAKRTLEMFTGNPELVLEANNSTQLKEYIKLATVTVSKINSSSNTKDMDSTIKDALDHASSQIEDEDMIF
ncbi:VWA domain-containing protein [Teredinibacter turnerae]|uniref:vWA domain-containing protein n=1 Tax=Teredinibacter turnerae TaxID=2426 RepID=UPI000381A47A|nr:VWA domain-containing protein [Teredinibacter turnerae]